MNYAELLQVIAATCLMTVALMLVLGRFHLSLKLWFQRYLPPRYLKPHGVRRRVSTAPTVSDAHDPS
ncbi:cellulose biosynthesis protein BcsF [Pseudomonas sp. Irchel 3A5]|uniref:cellulose biosynthesis protein BcsF n=1 Tax=Pseudomonas sp. Irchel 3A5 TaxID=2008911 RepID=UPI000BA4B2BC|nr:cellulose biosynthesis protein BcsF [Pseudomonas sp. Irchel 3A5]